METPDSPPSQLTPPYTHSLRLTFAYRGASVSLVRVQRVAMRALAVTTPPPDQNAAGYWIEVRDASDNVIYHQVLHDPMRSDVEVFGEGPDEPIYRVPNVAPQGEFDVIVPDLPRAARLTFKGSLATARTRRTAPKELLRIDFDQLRRGDVRAPQEEGES